jgi:hypothetical protein
MIINYQATAARKKERASGNEDFKGICYLKRIIDYCL